ncbi:MAG TPA: Na-translocating system protein MpsC family protein [Candidatus Limnocylindrales bacterium]|nr:Na-translocating system protein MpsC family protein [Candidatus Limnocylindrales bacterium]
MSDRSAAQAISFDVASIHAAGYECAVERISTIFEADSVTCELYIVLSPAEQLLLEDGHAAVREEREGFDRTLEPAWKAAVERATGRRVTAFLTKTRLSPHVTLLVFILGRPPPHRR